MTARLAVLLSLFASAAMANPLVGPSFRCPPTHTIIDAGATTYEVASRCRQPDDVVSSVEHRTVKHVVDHGRDETTGERVTEILEETVDVAVEVWTYDFGSNRFLQILRFENGRLVSVRDGPKGSAEPTRD